MKYIIALLWTVTCFCSCKKYLDEKTNKKLVIPVSLQDAQSLLDSYGLMNNSYPSIGCQSDDDYYLQDNFINTLNNVNYGNYTWAKDVINTADWGYLYQMILFTNVALETLNNVAVVSSNFEDWKRVYGSALFFRASAFYQLAQYYAVPYDQHTSSADAGIPLRLNSDINEKSVRSSLSETYDRIISDLKQASALLPVTSSIVSRPSKAAAFAALARTYLAMEDYLHAGQYADSCLQLSNILIDYNTLNAAASQPFSKFNPEVIVAATMMTFPQLYVNNLRVDSLLYPSYGVNDLRRTLFFQSNGTGTFGFKGSYDGSSNLFNGIATDEVYLIRSECRVRAGDVNGALSDLNTMLIKRYKAGTFIPVTATTPDDGLIKILNERRKELVFRGSRWFDLRRLNKDPRFAKTLSRKINGQLFTLAPNDPRYTEYIPLDVIAITGMEQNNR